MAFAFQGPVDDPHRPPSSSGSLNLQEAVRVPSLFAGPLTSVRFSKVLPPCGMEPISMISTHFLVSCLGVHSIGDLGPAGRAQQPPLGLATSKCLWTTARLAG
ncbi:hypothetical protein VULLAG_LOCUS13222 [Vulpes lagopus]